MFNLNFKLNLFNLITFLLLTLSSTIIAAPALEPRRCSKAVPSECLGWTTQSGVELLYAGDVSQSVTGSAFTCKAGASSCNPSRTFPVTVKYSNAGSNLGYDVNNFASLPNNLVATQSIQTTDDGKGTNCPIDSPYKWTINFNPTLATNVMVCNKANPNWCKGYQWPIITISTPVTLNSVLQGQWQCVRNGKFGTISK